MHRKTKIKFVYHVLGMAAVLELPANDGRKHKKTICNTDWVDILPECFVRWFKKLLCV